MSPANTAPDAKDDALKVTKGKDFFTYQVSDGKGGADEATVIIEAKK